jgi:DNA-directed RNA polymerase specialized sigma24 family protein
MVLSRAADLVRRRAPSEPATLPSHLRTAMNQIQPRVGCAGIGTQPAETAEAREVLARLDESEREALLRFYLRGQQPAQICRELGLTEQAFSALKSRVRAKYRELTQCAAQNRLS